MIQGFKRDRKMGVKGEKYQLSMLFFFFFPIIIGFRVIKLFMLGDIFTQNQLLVQFTSKK